MKILFVCLKNMARSQMAEAFYERFFPEKEVKSAGYFPTKWFGKKLDETKWVKVCMDEEGIRRDRYPKQNLKPLDKKATDWADKIIVFDDLKGEWPDYLIDSQKVEVWDITDPRGTDLEFHRTVRDKIKDRVRNLNTNH